MDIFPPDELKQILIEELVGHVVEERWSWRELHLLSALLSSILFLGGTYLTGD